MEEITCRQTNCTAINTSVSTMSMYSLNVNPFFDILMTVECKDMQKKKEAIS